MNLIKFVVGDATEPIGNGIKIIPHVCNDIGKWGKGFVVALSKKWSIPEQKYLNWYESGWDGLIPFKLGATQFCPVERDIIVANIIGQHTVWSKNGVPPRQIFCN